MARPNVREKIVQAGLKRFHRAGFNGSSVEDITDLAGVPKGSFYNHFKSKEELAVEVIDRYADADVQGLLTDTAVAPLMRLKRYFAALVERFAHSDYKRGCLVGNLSSELADHSAPVRRRLESSFASWAKQIANVLKEAQRAGEVDSKLKPDLLAGFLLSAFEGALLRARAANDPMPLKEFTSVTFNYLLR